MKFFLALFGLVMVAHGAPQDFEVAVRAPSTSQNCDCQCDSYTLSSKGRIMGNCISPDVTGNDFCYISGRALRACRDVQISESRAGSFNNPGKYFSYEACSTPPRNQCVKSSVGNSGSGSNFGDGDNGVAQFGGSPSDRTGGFGGQVGGFDRQSDTNTAISGGIGGSEPVINLKSILRSPIADEAGGDQEVFTQIKNEDGNNGNPPIPQQNKFSKCGMNEVPPQQIVINYEAGFWPWMGSLGFWSDGKWNHQCGATLVNQIHFITAAHCIENQLDVQTRWKIRHGDTNLEDSSDDGRAIDFDILKIFKHPKYTGKAYYDIAVLQINPVEFLSYRRPVCLPDPSNFKLDQYEEKTTTLIGWGSKELNGKTSSTLKRTILTIYEYSYCNETHRNANGEAKQSVQNYLPELFLPNLLCAGYATSEQGSCKGDSGGPLMIYKASFLQHFQVGVVSGGVSKCGDKSIPSYFTRLDHPEIANFISAPNTYFRS